MSKKDVEPEKNVNTRKKLVIWFGGSSETEDQIRENLEVIKETKGVKVVLIDGVGTEKNVEASKYIMAKPEGLRKVINRISNLLANRPEQFEGLLYGYKKPNHIVQQRKAIEAIKELVAECEPKNEKFDLLVGGFSRGAAVALPVFLHGITKKGKKIRKSSYFDDLKIPMQELLPETPDLKGKIASLEVIAIDPVMGKAKQNVFGLDQNQKIKRVVPSIIGIFKNLKDELGLKKIGVSVCPVRYESLTPLEADRNWMDLVYKNKGGIKFTDYIPVGLNHSALAVKDKYNVYSGASPNDLLNELLRYKLGIKSKRSFTTLNRKIVLEENDKIQQMKLGRAKPIDLENARSFNHIPSSIGGVEVPRVVRYAHHLSRVTGQQRFLENNKGLNHGSRIVYGEMFYKPQMPKVTKPRIVDPRTSNHRPHNPKVASRPKINNPRSFNFKNTIKKPFL